MTLLHVLRHSTVVPSDWWRSVVPTVGTVCGGARTNDQGSKTGRGWITGKRRLWSAWACRNARLARLAEGWDRVLLMRAGAMGSDISRAAQKQEAPGSQRRRADRAGALPWSNKQRLRLGGGWRLKAERPSTSEASRPWWRVTIRSWTLCKQRTAGRRARKPGSQRLGGGTQFLLPAS